MTPSRGPFALVVHSSISKSPSELPKAMAPARIGCRCQRRLQLIKSPLQARIDRYESRTRGRGRHWQGLSCPRHPARTHGRHQDHVTYAGGRSESAAPLRTGCTRRRRAQSSRRPGDRGVAQASHPTMLFSTPRAGDQRRGRTVPAEQARAALSVLPSIDVGAARASPVLLNWPEKLAQAATER